jgi:hypothetical protein
MSSSRNDPDLLRPKCGQELVDPAGGDVERVGVLADGPIWVLSEQGHQSVACRHDGIKYIGVRVGSTRDRGS